MEDPGSTTRTDEAQIEVYDMPIDGLQENNKGFEPRNRDEPFIKHTQRL